MNTGRNVRRVRVCRTDLSRQFRQIGFIPPQQGTRPGRVCYGVTGTNARGELFNQNATDKTSGRFALKAVQFAGEGSPEPITPIRVTGEKQPVRNLAFHADSPLSACGPGRRVPGAWNSKAARLRCAASLRAVLICVDLRTRLPMIRPPMPLPGRALVVRSAGCADMPTKTRRVCGRPPVERCSP